MKKIAGVLLLLAVIAFGAMLGLNLEKLRPQQEQDAYAENIEDIRNLQALDASWSLATLQTYTTPNSDFDQVASFLPQVRELRNRLATGDLSADEVPDAIKNKLNRFLLLIESKEESIEQFKSNFAVVRNSIKYLPLASQTLTARLRQLGDQEQAQRITAIFDRTNAFLQNPDEGTQMRLLMELSKMNEDLMSFPEEIVNPLGNFISHARVLVERKIQLNSSINDVAAQNARKVGDELISLYKSYHEKAREQALARHLETYQLVLIWATLLVIAGLISAFLLWLAARQFDAKLEKRVAERTEEIEQAAAKASDSLVGKNLDSSLAGMGNMAATVAHEINTPLGYLDSNLQVLHSGMEKMQLLMNEFVTLKKDLRETEDAGQINARLENFGALVQNIKDEAMLDELPEIIDDMQEGVQQIQHVTNDLRDFTRKDRSPQDWFDIEQCVTSALKMAQKEIPPETKIITSLKNLPKVYGSPAEINQVLMNLITNAAHAVEAAGRDKGSITIKAVEQKGHILVSVMDTGQGIDEKTRSKIFEPFFTTKDVGKGTGLGLAIVRRIITAHGGKVFIKSIVGKGTNFIFTLPVKRQPGEE
ncbi:DAHL domain-containing protein [Thiolapillus sp.]